ncbi:MAG: hypothetical protein DRJ43_04190, partial [Thermoprotei archaeon]
MSERFCFKCGRRLSVGVLYCSHCGYPASLYLTASPPLLRLTYKLSLTILVSGFLLAALADIVIPHLFPKLPMVVVDLLVQLSDTVAIPLIVVGAILLVSTAAKYSLRPWLTDFIVAAGFALNLAYWAIARTWGGLLYTPEYHLWLEAATLISHSSYVMILVGIAARKMIDRELRLLNVKVMYNRFSTQLALLTALIPPLTFIMLPGGWNLRIAYLSLLGWPAVGLATWAIWDLTAERVFRIYLFKN